MAQLRRMRFSGIVSFTLILTLAGAGCTTTSNPGANGNTDNTETEHDVTVNTDPADETIMEIVSADDGAKLTYVGEKDAETGLATAIEEVKIWGPDMDYSSTPYSMKVNEEGMPTEVTAPDGSVAVITYDGQTMTVNYTGADGSTSTETYTLPEQQTQKAIQTRSLDRRGRVTSRLPLLFSWRDIPIDDYATINMKLTPTIQHYDFGSKPDDVKLTGATFTLEGPENAKLSEITESNGVYTFEIIHKVVNLDKARAELSSIDNWASGIFTVVGVGSAIIAHVLGAATLGPGGILIAEAIGHGMVGAGLLQCASNLFSGDIIREEAIAEGFGDQKTVLVISHSDLKTPHKLTYEYDVFDLKDPVMAAEKRKTHGEIEEVIMIDGCDYLASELATNQAAVDASPNNADAQCLLAKNKQAIMEADCTNSYDENAVQDDYDKWCDEGGDEPEVVICDMSAYVTYELKTASKNSNETSCEQYASFTNTSDEKIYLKFFQSQSYGGVYGESNTWAKGKVTLYPGETQDVRIAAWVEYPNSPEIEVDVMRYSKYLAIAAEASFLHMSTSCYNQLDDKDNEVDGQIDEDKARELEMNEIPIPYTDCEWN